MREEQRVAIIGSDPLRADSTTMTPTDARLLLLLDWLPAQPQAFGIRPDSLRPASADASFRRYFRVDALGVDGGTLIIMDAPPDREDSRPFVRVAGLLSAAGLHAPQIVMADLAQGFLLLSDLGPTTYLQAMQVDRMRAPALFTDAIDALIKWQLASRPATLPPYDAALLRRELDLFPDWYVARHLQHELTVSQRQTLETSFTTLIDACLAQPRVFVHRDYMPRNLMTSMPNPGVLDFQDAVCGPITYDVVSLFRDAFISWEEERVLDWTIRYWEKARAAGLPVAGDFADFWRAFEWMGLQRHLKVLGIFARIQYRDGKPQYLADTPRFLGYVRAVTTRYVALAPLARLFDELEARPRTVGYTF